MLNFGTKYSWSKNIFWSVCVFASKGDQLTSSSSANSKCSQGAQAQHRRVRKNHEERENVGKLCSMILFLNNKLSIPVMTTKKTYGWWWSGQQLQRWCNFQRRCDFPGKWEYSVPGCRRGRRMKRQKRILEQSLVKKLRKTLKKDSKKPLNVVYTWERLAQLTSGPRGTHTSYLLSLFRTQFCSQSFLHMNVWGAITNLVQELAVNPVWNNSSRWKLAEISRLVSNVVYLTNMRYGKTQVKKSKSYTTLQSSSSMHW